MLDTPIPILRRASNKTRRYLPYIDPTKQKGDTHTHTERRIYVLITGADTPISLGYTSILVIFIRNFLLLFM